MSKLYMGTYGRTNFMWLEDEQNDRCRMIDWEMNADMVRAHVDEYDENGLSDEYSYGEWRDGVTAIRGEMERAWILRDGLE